MVHQGANTISGTQLAAEIQSEAAGHIQALGIMPGLAVVLVGTDPASERYVSIKQKAANSVGIAIHVYKLPEFATQDEVLATIDFLNADEQVHAILVQLPLPKHLDEHAVISRVDPKKDVDGFHPKNIQAFLGDQAGIAPGLVMGIIQLITATQEPLEGATAAIVAKSAEFTGTLVHALAPFGVAGKAVRPDAEELARATRAAGIVITAVGKPHWLTKDMIREGAIIIDVGASEINGKIAGDVDASCKEKAAWISPVPGGVGPMTVAMLLKNTVMLARMQSEAL